MASKDKVLVAATNNAHKLVEINEILKDIGYTCIAQRDAGADVDPDETGATFEQNSYLKAKAVFDICGRAVLADDSGLMVDALGGRPGVRTARYAGEHGNAEKNIEKLLGELEGTLHEQRTARFVSVVTAILPGGETFTARGFAEGYIGYECKGAGGFGYDPIFYLWNDRAFAELTDAEKNRVSHRARAVRKLVFKLRGVKRIRRLPQQRKRHGKDRI